MPEATGERDLRASVEGREWYHSLDLAPGILTPGYFDLRRVPERIAFPATLDGARCLDVGTFDGFWAFEMERRGAAEVVAIDILDPSGWDWPAGSESSVKEAIGRRKDSGSGFEIAARAFGSGVRRIERSVYDLDPAQDGRFDFVYVGSLLLHLRDPVRALTAVASVARGDVLAMDAIDLGLTIAHPRRAIAELDGAGRPWWWRPNVAGLVAMVRAAGLEPTSKPRRVMLPAGAGHVRARLRPRLLSSHEARLTGLRSWVGDPHAALTARPR